MSIENKDGERLKSPQVHGFAWSVPVTTVWTNTWESASGSYLPILLVATIGTVDRSIRPATEDGSAIRRWIVTMTCDALDIPRSWWTVAMIRDACTIRDSNPA